MPFINLKNKTSRFFVLASILYLSWYLLYQWVVKPHTKIDEKLISLIIANTTIVLKLFGFSVYSSVENPDLQLIGIDGSHPIWIGSPCNALTLFMFFTLFVMAFPGSIKRKLWFIPLGVIIIHIINVLRVVALITINFYAPQYIEFNHTYTFTILVYSIIFLLWMWWVNSSLKEFKTNASNN